MPMSPLDVREVTSLTVASVSEALDLTLLWKFPTRNKEASVAQKEVSQI